MSGSTSKIIAGLGNPGDKYARTRHNIGFETVEALASHTSQSIQKVQFDAHYVKTRISGNSVFLVKPMTYMNRSGFAVQKFASYYKIKVEDIIIVHDDMDLEFGKIKIVKSRGHGGHNGVRSIIECFGNKDFIRVRLGVGHPGSGKNVTGHVLGKFSSEEKETFNQLISKGKDACVNILENGVTSAMNTFNSK